MPRKCFRSISFLLCVSLLCQQVGFAQVAGQLDLSGLFSLQAQIRPPDVFRPQHLRYLSYDEKANAFKIILDQGNAKSALSEEVKDISKTLLNYFLVGVSLPNDVFWVNLRPDAPERMIDDAVAQTDIGEVFLAADVELKKDTAKFTSPQTSEGREYWDKLYKKAEEVFGADKISIPTLTRPWIVPDEIIVRETPTNAYIYKATLKVLLEQDHLKAADLYAFKDERLKILNAYASDLVRELIIPKLTKEVNTAERYAPLRQVYYSLILAQWFKKRFYGKNGLYSSLIDSKNLTGLTSKRAWKKEAYFQAYQKSFKDGEYNIQETVSTLSGRAMRTYVSGGVEIGNLFGAGQLGSALPGTRQEFHDGPTSATLVTGNPEVFNPESEAGVAADKALLGVAGGSSNDLGAQAVEPVVLPFRSAQGVSLTRLLDAETLTRPAALNNEGMFLFDANIWMPGGSKATVVRDAPDGQEFLVPPGAAILVDSQKVPGFRLISEGQLSACTGIAIRVRKGGKEYYGFVHILNQHGVYAQSLFEQMAFVRKTLTETLGFAAADIDYLIDYRDDEYRGSVENIEAEVLRRNQGARITFHRRAKNGVILNDFAVTKAGAEIQGEKENQPVLSAWNDASPRTEVSVQAPFSVKTVSAAMQELMFQDVGDMARKLLGFLTKDTEGQDEETTLILARPEDLSQAPPPELKTREQAMQQIESLLASMQANRESGIQKGAVVHLENLPEGSQVIMIGDLHAHPENLQAVLSDQDNLKKIQEGKAVLVILGDAAHPELTERQLKEYRELAANDPVRAQDLGERILSEMDSSIVTMQLIMDLKIANPQGVHYVLGNHDYFSPKVNKGNVFQGLLYRKTLIQYYGREFFNKYQAFLSASPLMMSAKGVLAVHAGPVKSRQGLSMELIENAPAGDDSDPLVGQLTRSRYIDKKYTEEDVANFVAQMNQPGVPLIVGHSPFREVNEKGEANWHWEVFPGHHIIFAGHRRMGYALLENGVVRFVEVAREDSRGYSQPISAVEWLGGKRNRQSQSTSWIFRMAREKGLDIRKMPEINWERWDYLQGKGPRAGLTAAEAAEEGELSSSIVALGEALMPIEQEITETAQENGPQALQPGDRLVTGATRIVLTNDGRKIVFLMRRNGDPPILEEAPLEDLQMQGVALHVFRLVDNQVPNENAKRLNQELVIDANATKRFLKGGGWETFVTVVIDPQGRIIDFQNLNELSPEARSNREAMMLRGEAFQVVVKVLELGEGRLYVFERANNPTGRKVPDLATQVLAASLSQASQSARGMAIELTEQERAELLGATKLCDVQSSGIRSAALDVTSGSATDLLKARALWEWLKNNITYGIGHGGYWDATASETLETKSGMCFNSANLFIAMARSLGIPCRYVVVKIQDSGFEQVGIQIETPGMMKYSSDHVYAELFIGGQWQKFDMHRDPALERAIPPQRFVDMDAYAIRRGRKNTRIERDLLEDGRRENVSRRFGKGVMTMAELEQAIAFEAPTQSTDLSQAASGPADVGIASDNSAGLTRQSHEDFHRQGKFSEVLDAIALELGIKHREDGKYDIRGTIASDGRTSIDPVTGDRVLKITRKDGGTTELSITAEDGLLVIIDDRFQKDHAGRGEFMVFARNAAKAAHEKRELMLWRDFAIEHSLASAQDVAEGRLGFLLRDWINGRGAFSASEADLVQRLEQVKAQAKAFHEEALKVERFVRIEDIDPAEDEVGFIAQEERSSDQGAQLLKPNEPRSIAYVTPIIVDLAPGRPGEMQLRVMHYEDIPADHSLKGELNKSIGYFLISQKNPLEFKALRDGEEVEIGRNNPYRFTLSSDVSRIHVRIKRQGDVFIITDLGSTYRTNLTGAQSGKQGALVQAKGERLVRMTTHEGRLNHTLSVIKEFIRSFGFGAVIYDIGIGADASTTRELSEAVRGMAKVIGFDNQMPFFAISTQAYRLLLFDENNLLIHAETSQGTVETGDSVDEQEKAELEAFAKQMREQATAAGSRDFTDSEGNNLIFDPMQRYATANLALQKGNLFAMAEAVQAGHMPKADVVRIMNVIIPHFTPRDITRALQSLLPVVNEGGVVLIGYASVMVSGQEEALMYRKINGRFILESVMLGVAIEEGTFEFGVNFGGWAEFHSMGRGVSRKLFEFARAYPRFSEIMEFLRAGRKPYWDAYIADSRQGYGVEATERGNADFAQAAQGWGRLVAASVAESLVKNGIAAQALGSSVILKLRTVAGEGSVDAGFEKVFREQYINQGVPEEVLPESEKDFVIASSGQAQQETALPEGNNPIKRVPAGESNTLPVNNVGGVDFRNMPIGIESIRSGAPSEISDSASALEGWSEIENMMRAGIIPSSERMREYLTLSCSSSQLNNEISRVLFCIAQILRMEEERLVNTEPALSQMLGLLESDKQPKELKEALEELVIISRDPA